MSIYELIHDLMNYRRLRVSKHSLGVEFELPIDQFIDSQLSSLSCQWIRLDQVLVVGSIFVLRDGKARHGTSCVTEKGNALRLLRTDEAKLAGLVQEVLRVVLGRNTGDFFLGTV